MQFVSINPSTEEVVASYPEDSPAQVESALRSSVAASTAWHRAGVADRGAVLERAAGILEASAEECALLMATEMGKPLPQGRAEIEKCAWVCRYYAEHGGGYLEEETVGLENGDAYVSYRPLGPILAVMPWNFPFWQVFRFAAPAMMAGNVVLLKHAPNVLGCAEAIERIWQEASAPAGVFQNLKVHQERVPPLIHDARVRGVTLTGSTRAGKSVAAVAGEALKKSVVELGGSDAYVVLADADVERAARTCVASRLINGGQSCIAAKRFIVEKPVAEEFTSRVIALMSEVRCGDPVADESVDMGPLARSDLRRTLDLQVTESITEGAVCALGGTVPDRTGSFYPPTVLTDVTPAMRVFREETFGPVAAISVAADEQEAFDLANGTVFGLGGAVFTADRERGRRLAEERLDAGFCAVNDFVRSDPRLPFGGVRESGYGRELARSGMLEFVNVKTVSVADA